MFYKRSTSSLFFRLCASLIATISSASLAEEAFPEAFEQKPVSRFVPSSSEFFGPLAPAAKRLVQAEKRNHRPQHFCAIGYQYADGSITVPEVLRPYLGGQETVRA